MIFPAWNSRLAGNIPHQPEHQQKHLLYNQANQRLEQALSRNTESERISAELGLEAQKLRERLAAALSETPDKDNDSKPDSDAATTADATPAAANAEGQDIGDNAVSPVSTKFTPVDATAAATIDGLRRDFERASAEIEAQASALQEERERASGLETRLAAEQENSEKLLSETRALSARAEGAEKAEEEAMTAAAAEARRAAEVREEAEGAGEEVARLRGRLAEWEEEGARAVEVKGALETTRDALDELRWGPGGVEILRSGMRGV